MNGQIVAIPNQSLVTFNEYHFRIVLIKNRQIRVVIPKFRKWGSNVRPKHLRMASMEISDSRGQKKNLSRRLITFYNQIAHVQLFPLAKSTMLDSKENSNQRQEKFQQ
jgi:hypothetical protein